MTERVSPQDVETWQSAVGRSESRTETLEVESLRRFAAAIGQDLDFAGRQPSLAHWAFFLPLFPDSEIGEDGHPRRGGFMPAITLPRRMFASAKMTFSKPLALGRAATRTSTVAAVNHKPGRSGDLVFVDVEHVIAQDGATCVVERQTIVYRGEGDPVGAVVPREQVQADGDEIWRPGPVNLFRFSAVTFNSHRIHYDQPYTTQREGYPGLVVHGPFTAAKLHNFARDRAGGELKAFAFRAVAPLFVDQPVRLTTGEEAGSVLAVRCDGAPAMTATAQ